jgi:hypothetical protein
VKPHFPSSLRFRTLILPGALAAATLLGLICSATHRADAATANSTVTTGDVFILANNLNGFSQIENGVRAGGVVSYGSGATEQLGGIFANASGLYLAGNLGTGLTVEKISLGQTVSAPVLAAADFTGGGGTLLRDLVVHTDGTIFTLYTNGAVDQFTPNGGGGFTRTSVGTFTGFTSADRGSGHQLSISLNGQYLLTSSRTQNSVWSLSISSGAVQQWVTPAGLNGPVSGIQLTLSATSVLDPVRGNRLLAPMGNDGLYEVAFDPATGTFPNVTPFRLSNDGIAAFIDGLVFDGDGDLNVSTRNDASIGSLREFTQTELVAASAGTPFAVMTKPAYYTATDARVARDVAIVVPEPSVAALLVGAVACMTRRRRRTA